MNPAERRKQILQVVVLVVLLGILAVSMTFMLRTVTRSQRPATQTQAQATTTQTTAGGETSPADSAGAAVGTAAVAEGVPEQFNPNVFRVYSLNPPKNPFVQEERWYTEELTEGLPGYPELRDNEFFNDMGTDVPELEALLPEDETWRQIQVKKDEDAREYNLVGESDDGMIKTRMTYYGDPGRELDLTWTESSGMPISALAEMDVFSRLDDIPRDMTENGDLFSPPANGLSVPGMGDLFSTTGGGQLLVCQGVSGKGGNATALIIYNETPRIVQAGDALPPRFTVEAVTENGVALREVDTGETVWLPIGGQSTLSAGPIGGVRPPV